jgi:hypothetical protein
MHVVVVGDSLIATTATEQAAELTRRGYVATVHGNPGRPLTHPWTQARLDEARGADIVVIATASNDNLQLAQRADAAGMHQAAHTYAQDLTRSLHRVGAPCTVLVDAREAVAPIYRPETAATTNRILREVSLATRRTVVVAWSSTSAGHDHNDWFVDDELHFTDDTEQRAAGVQAYVHSVADGVDACRSRLVS